MTSDETKKNFWKHCPVCDSTVRVSHVAFDELEFVRCLQCSAVYKSRESVDLRPVSFYEDEYFLGRSSKRHMRFEHRVKKAIRQIREGLEFTKAVDLLDVGCALGYVLEGGKRIGLDSSGLDVSEFAINFCRQLGFEARQGTLESIPWADQSFDLVIMKHVLEHTPEPKRALSEVQRVLRPGGCVVATVPSLRYWKGLLFKRRYRYFRPDDLGMQHYVYYTPKTLASVFSNSGFEILVRSKVTFRHRQAQRGLFAYSVEALRFVGLGIWQVLASALFQRRELLIVARKSD